LSTKAVLLTPRGNRRTVPMEDALAVLRHGQAELVHRHPLTVAMIPRCLAYEDEARYLKGHRVEKATTGQSAGDHGEHAKVAGMPRDPAPWSGVFNTRRNTWTRKPRAAYNAEYEAYRQQKARDLTRYGDEGELIVESVRSEHKRRRHEV
jgi:hypothetical protein